MIYYLEGDATLPVKTPAIIPHVCNNVGGWGAGFVLALNARWPEPKRAYKNWHLAKCDSFKLGSVQFVDCEPGITVANMIGQEGIAADLDGTPPVRYGAIEDALEKVRDHAYSLNSWDHQVTIHMPRIGCGLAGGSWSIIEKILNEVFSQGPDIYVYDLPPTKEELQTRKERNV